MKSRILISMLLMAAPVTLFAQLKVQSFPQSFVEKEYFEKHTDLGGDVLLKKKHNEVNGDRAFTSFDIEVPVSGQYYVYFWLCPAELADGSFSEYDVFENETFIGKIKPTEGDWQAISIENSKKVSLKEGVCKISVVGKIPDVPSVEFIRLSMDAEKAKISDKDYKDYKAKVWENSHLQAEENGRFFVEGVDTVSVNKARDVSFPLSPQPNPPYDAKYYIGYTINYTFYKTVYYQQGQTANISSTGVTNFIHVLEFFSKTSPDSYSWSSISSGNTASISVSIPETGYYIVRVRTYWNATSGLCNLTIDNTSYNNVAVYSFGIKGNKDTQNVYNSFTCYRNGDPMIWVEEGSLPGTIRAYNDDYTSSSSDFSWSLNSRVKRQYGNTVNSILLSTYGSYNPSCTCDIYCNCLSRYTNISDNFIKSAPGSYDYRCISWAGGIYSCYIWPPDEFSGLGLNDLEAFDYFFGMERYPGCSIFTRNGATEGNSTVDLWATNNNGLKYQHASVRKGAENNAHGFDWESKCGADIRLYHPRNHVPFTSYGQVVEHYRKVDRGTVSISLEESIANGWAVLENVHFTNNELAYIDSQIQRVSDDVLNDFNTMYEKWQQVWNTSCFSNPDVIADCDEYRELLALSQKTELLKYAIFKKLDEGNDCAMCLIKDLYLPDKMELLERVFDSNNKQKHTDSGAKIVRTMHSNAMLFVKELLKEQIETFKSRISAGNETGISFSNSDDYLVRQANSSVILSFNLGNTARVYADIISLQGDIIAKLVDDRFLQPDTYMFQGDVPKGVYLIRYIKDGTVNVKKIRTE